MPLYELRSSQELIPFRRLPGGPELYEREIEELIWHNPEDLLGESLFLIARQPTLPLGGRPDVVALAPDARVVVVEVKRDVDRSQLAQTLEYAGWARRTNLDELSAMYHRPEDGAFFRDWVEFTDSTHPPVVNRRPRLILVAFGFHDRTESALEFLIENGVPVRVIRVSIYEDGEGRRFLDIESDHEPELVVEGESRETERDHTRIRGRRVLVADLIEAGLLAAGDSLTWHRPRLGVTYRAKVLKNGAIELDDGRVFASPSVAAIRAADIPASDGWYVWRVDDRGGTLLNDLRIELANREASSGRDGTG
jgi:hypothetical protein